ncbi:MAG: DUF4256 domain-containing protein [Flavobacteriales bacterium]|nr:DUF4256 domain-containing protein [Flavobacteriales bacterium]
MNQKKTMELPREQRVELLSTLKVRFAKHMHRHAGISWEKVLDRLEANGSTLWSLQEMERTGGEPDVIGRDEKTGQFLFCDCAAESPSGRRSLCFDREGLESRKEHRPADSAMDVASAMGIELLTEEQYRHLQQFGPLDAKTSSWLLTPPAIRKLGGAIFGDFRYGQVFVYHNGAQSYYGARGFRGMVRV